MNATYKTLTSRTLSHEQKLMELAKHAENSIDVIEIDRRTKHYFKTGAINDLAEGNAPYRPRYIQPDYDKFVKRGSEFLKLEGPNNLSELLVNLSIIYSHVPSITNFPVYLGSIDRLIDKFLTTDMSDTQVIYKLKLFFTYLDRTITDSFCHANIGPEETRAGRLILRAIGELKNTVPNLTVLYDPKLTHDDFIEESLKTALISSNPAISNHTINSKVYDRYGICSCYNILPLDGGAYTLTRITLSCLAKEAKSRVHFLNELLPECVELICKYMNHRIRFIVEKSGFFESSFLVRENLIDRNRFLGMFGVAGLAECVNTIMANDSLVYGKNGEADDFGIEILESIENILSNQEAIYSPITNNKFLLHAQVGLHSDVGITSGVRIPVRWEPEDFVEHIRHSGRFHKYFPAGVGDIFPIASHVKNNPSALLDIVKGAFLSGIRYISFYSENADLVRITGYLVKRSEIEKINRNEVVLQNTTQLGGPTYNVNDLEHRKVRMS